MSETTTLLAPPPKTVAPEATAPEATDPEATVLGATAPKATAKTDAAPAPPASASAPPRPSRWTADAYLHAIERGAFPPTLRAELIRGQIVERMPIGPKHAYTLDVLTDLAYQRIERRYVVRTQGPARLSEHSRVEPDVMLLVPPRARYAQADPAAYDILLLCEVADSTLHFDRHTKLALYAEAGVPEYWIVNVRAAELERHTDPRPDGTYATKAAFANPKDRDSKAQTLQHERLGDVVLEGLFAPAEEAVSEPAAAETDTPYATPPAEA